MKKTKISLGKLQLKKDNVMDLTAQDNVKGGDGLTIVTVCRGTAGSCLDDTCGSQVPQNSIKLTCPDACTIPVGHCGTFNSYCQCPGTL